MTTTEYVEEYIDTTKYDLPYPEKGKAWKRKSDGFTTTHGVVLGKIFFKNGELLKKPIVETVDGYELIDIAE